MSSSSVLLLSVMIVLLLSWHSVIFVPRGRISVVPISRRSIPSRLGANPPCGQSTVPFLIVVVCGPCVARRRGVFVHRGFAASENALDVDAPCSSCRGLVCCDSGAGSLSSSIWPAVSRASLFRSRLISSMALFSTRKTKASRSPSPSFEWDRAWR